VSQQNDIKSQWDIIILGAGPAGANAALRAARAGKNVLLIDEQCQAGGQVWRAKSAAIKKAPQTPESLAGDQLRRRLSEADITFMKDCRVWQIERHEDKQFCLNISGKNTLASVRCDALIIATGANERVIPVPGWTLPGVWGLAGATSIFKEHMMVPGQATIINGTGPLVFFVAAEILRLGGTVRAVVTPNNISDWLKCMPVLLMKPSLLLQGLKWLAVLKKNCIPIYWRHHLRSISGTNKVEGVEIGPVTKQWAPDLSNKTISVKADSVCMGHGLNPAIEASRLLGAEHFYDENSSAWVPLLNGQKTSIPGLFCAGDNCGIFGAAAAPYSGELAAIAAISHLDNTPVDPNEHKNLSRKLHIAKKFGTQMTRLSKIRTGIFEHMADDTILCRCERLTKSEVEAEILSGATSTNSVKSGVRAGMGACGGRYCLHTVNQLLSQNLNVPVSEISPATARPPLRPVCLQAITEDFEYQDLPIPKPAPL